MSEQKKKRLMPELRFPEFRNAGEWEKKQLSELLFETKHRNRNRKQEYGPQDVLSVSGEYGCVNQIELMGRSYAGASVENYPVVEIGDLVYTKSPLKKNPYGIIKENKGKPGIVSTLYAIYRVTDLAHPAFLDHYFSSNFNLNSYLQPIVNKGAKNDMKVKNSHVLSGEIPAPKKEEQKKIADCLTSVDQLITDQTQKLNALMAHKKGLVRQLFPAEGETVPKLRFSEFQDKGEWVMSTIGDISEIASGGTPSRLIPEYWNGDIPWVSTTLIDFNTIEKVNEYITQDGLNNSSTKIFPQGTILMAMYGQGKTRGKVAMLGINASINQACAAILLNEEMNTEFVFQNLAARYDEIRKISNPGGQENLSATLIKKISFPYPDIESGEQQKIADCLASIDELISNQAKKVESLKSHKKGLMQKLFPAMDEVSA
jgi:type I restriction enzyme, S subunit